MRAAIDGVDVVREGEDLLVEAVVPLQGDMHLGAIDFTLHCDGPVEQYGLVLVEQLDVGDDPAVVFEIVRFVVALVAHHDAQAGVEERQLAHAIRQHVEIEVGRFQYRRIGLERHLRAA